MVRKPRSKLVHLHCGLNQHKVLVFIPFINLLFLRSALFRVMGVAGASPNYFRVKVEYTMSSFPVHCRVTHTYLHLISSLKHVFGLWKEAGVPGETHTCTERTCKLHSKKHSGFEPGPSFCEETVQTSKPPCIQYLILILKEPPNVLHRCSTSCFLYLICKSLILGLSGNRHGRYCKADRGVSL